MIAIGWRLLKPFLPQIGIALAIVGAVWWIHHAGAMDERRDWQAREARDRALAYEQTRVLSEKLAGALSRVDARTAHRIGAIEALRTTIIKPMLKEISVETRYHDAACNLTDGVWGGLAQAVAATASAGGPDGSVTVALPGPDDAE